MAAIYAVVSLAPPMSSVIASLVIAGVFLVLGLIFAAIGWFVLRVRPLERTQETVRAARKVVSRPNSVAAGRP